MTYELIPSGLSGFGAFGGAGDALGEGCLCGGSGVCNTAKLQGPAMAQLRAAMAAAGIPTRSGNWTTAEQNALNAFATAHGQPTSSKFLVDGGPCRALKAALSAPAPTPGGSTTTTGGVTCASLLSQAPPIPPGTPIDAVIAVLQQLAPPGFDVRACVANSTPATTVPTPGGGTVVLPPGTAGGSVTTVTTGDTSGLSPLMILGLGLVAVMGVGGIAFVALSPKMRKNGRRRRGRKMRRNGSVSSPAVRHSKNVYHAGYRAGTARAGAYEDLLSHRGMTSTASNAIQKEGLAIAKRKASLSAKDRANFANGFYFGVADAHGLGGHA